MGVQRCGFWTVHGWGGRLICGGLYHRHRKRFLEGRLWLWGIGRWGCGAGGLVGGAVTVRDWPEGLWL